MVETMVIVNAENDYFRKTTYDSHGKVKSSVTFREQECCGKKIEVYYIVARPGGRCPKCGKALWF